MAYATNINSLVKGIEPAVSAVGASDPKCPSEEVVKMNARMTACRLQGIHSLDEGDGKKVKANRGVKVVSAYYELGTGRVHFDE